MSWIIIILVIYTIYITSTNAIDLNGKSFSSMDKKEAAIAVNDILQERLHIPPIKELQYEKDLEQFEQSTGKLTSSAKKTVRGLRTLADRLDEAWWEFKMKYAAASFACVIGGVITATTRNVVGIGFGIAGAVVSIKAHSIKNDKDLEDYKEAERLLSETKDDFIAVRKMIHEWSVEKDYVRMIYIYKLAEFNEVVSPQVLMILREFIFESMGIHTAKEAVHFLKKAWQIFGSKAAVQGAKAAEDALHAGAETKDLGKAGWKTVGESQKNLMVVLETAFLVLDAIDFGYTVMDLVQNKGSDTAKDLRKRAKEIEDAFIQ